MVTPGSVPAFYFDTTGVGFWMALGPADNDWIGVAVQTGTIGGDAGMEFNPASTGGEVLITDGNSDELTLSGGSAILSDNASDVVELSGGQAAISDATTDGLLATPGGPVLIANGLNIAFQQGAGSPLDTVSPARPNSFYVNNTSGALWYSTTTSSASWVNIVP